MQTIIIPLAGDSSRFFNAGYSMVKYKLPIFNAKPVLWHILSYIDRESKLLIVLNAKFNDKTWANNLLIDLGFAHFEIVEVEKTDGQLTTVDLGINNKVNENLDIGFLIRNIGREFSDNLRLNNEILIGVGAKYFMPNLNLVFLSDFFIFEQNKYLKLSTITTLPYLNFIVGGTYSDSYKDFSFGIKLDYKKWAIVFGNLNHNNTALGSPSSIEIMKSF